MPNDNISMIALSQISALKNTGAGGNLDENILAFINSDLPVSESIVAEEGNNVKQTILKHIEALQHPLREAAARNAAYTMHVALFEEPERNGIGDIKQLLEAAHQSLMFWKVASIQLAEQATDNKQNTGEESTESSSEKVKNPDNPYDVVGYIKKASLAVKNKVNNILASGIVSSDERETYDAQLSEFIMGIGNTLTYIGVQLKDKKLSGEIIKTIQKIAFADEDSVEGQFEKSYQDVLKFKNPDEIEKRNEALTKMINLVDDKLNADKVPFIENAMEAFFVLTGENIMSKPDFAMRICTMLSFVPGAYMKGTEMVMNLLINEVKQNDGPSMEQLWQQALNGLAMTAWVIGHEGNLSDAKKVMDKIMSIFDQLRKFYPKREQLILDCMFRAQEVNVEEEVNRMWNYLINKEEEGSVSETEEQPNEEEGESADDTAKRAESPIGYKLHSFDTLKVLDRLDTLSRFYPLDTVNALVGLPLEVDKIDADRWTNCNKNVLSTFYAIALRVPDNNEDVSKAMWTFLKDLCAKCEDESIAIRYATSIYTYFYGKNSDDDDIRKKLFLAESTNKRAALMAMAEILALITDDIFCIFGIIGNHLKWAGSRITLQEGYGMLCDVLKHYVKIAMDKSPQNIPSLFTKVEFQVWNAVEGKPTTACVLDLETFYKDIIVMVADNKEVFQRCVLFTSGNLSAKIVGLFNRYRKLVYDETQGLVNKEAYKQCYDIFTEVVDAYFKVEKGASNSNVYNELLSTWEWLKGNYKFVLPSEEAERKKAAIENDESEYEPILPQQKSSVWT